MYEAVLLVLLVAASLKSETRFAAFALLFNWACNYFLVIEYGLFDVVPHVDGITFILLAGMTFFKPKWWAFLIALFAGAATAAHVVQGAALGMRVDISYEYFTFLRGAFILSAAILVIGGYDLGRYVGYVWNRLSLALHLCGRLRSSGKAALQGRQKVQ